MAFSFFQFWKKAEPKSKIPISEISLFSQLGPAELELIESKIRRVEYKKGDVVYRIGEKAEAFYMIVLGRFRVVGPKGEILTILSSSSIIFSGLTRMALLMRAMPPRGYLLPPKTLGSVLLIRRCTGL